MERRRVGSPEPKQTERATAVDALTGLLADDLAAVEHVIRTRMASAVGLIPDLAGYLIDAGGKRIRPIVTLAVANAMGGGGSAAHLLAASVEFIHSATLLHDDVVDESALRRGKAPANRLWGNAASVLVGDFLFARAFNLMVETDDLAVLAVLARASSVIAEGEVMQLVSARNPETTRERYLAIISAKTAELFSAAARVGAMAAGASPDQVEAMARFGLELGVGFQLVDDYLDYGGESAALGKSVGDDFRERKVTLPLLIAREVGDAEERAFWTRVIGRGEQNPGDLDRAIAILRRRGALARTLDEARQRSQTARECLGVLPPSPYRDALEDLTRFVVERAY